MAKKALTALEMRSLVATIRAWCLGGEVWTRHSLVTDRVTLSYLEVKGLLTRRVWTKEGRTSPAGHEYRPSDMLLEELRLRPLMGASVERTKGAER